MLNFKKGFNFNLKIISLLISVSFLFTTTLYSYPVSHCKDSLRLHIGAEDGDDTFDRMSDAMHQLQIDEPLKEAAREENRPRLSSLGFSELNENPEIARMLSMFNDLGLSNLTQALKSCCKDNRVQRFTPNEGEWVISDRGGNRKDADGHASDNYITIRAGLSGTREAAVLSHELLDWFNVKGKDGKHLGPAFEEALTEALVNNNSSYLSPFVKYLKNLNIDTRQDRLLAEASKAETPEKSTERHYTANAAYGRNLLEKVYEELDYGNIFLVPKWAVHLLFSKNANAGIIGPWENAPFPKEVFEQKLRDAGITGDQISIILNEGVILLGEESDKPPEYILVEELWHRMFTIMPDALKDEFNSSWSNLPAEWRHEISQNIWKGFYPEDRYGNEFWGYLLSELIKANIERKPLHRNLILLTSIPAVARLLRKYNLAEIHIRKIKEHVKIRKLDIRGERQEDSSDQKPTRSDKDKGMAHLAKQKTRQQILYEGKPWYILEEKLDELFNQIVRGDLSLEQIAEVIRELVIPTALVNTHWINRKKAIEILKWLSEHYNLESAPLFSLVSFNEDHPINIKLLDSAIKTPRIDNSEIGNSPNSDSLTATSPLMDSRYGAFQLYRLERERREHAELFREGTGKDISKIASYSELMEAVRVAVQRGGRPSWHYVNHYLEALPLQVPSDVLKNVIRPLTTMADHGLNRRAAEEILRRNSWRTHDESRETRSLTMGILNPELGEDMVTLVLFDGSNLIQQGKLNEIGLGELDEKISKLEPNEEAVIAVKLSSTQEEKLKEYFETRAIILNLNKLQSGTDEYNYFIDIITNQNYRNALRGEGLRLQDARKYLDKA